MNKRLFWIIISVFSLFVLDRFLRQLAISGVTKKIHFFNFSLSTNPDIALGIPLQGVLFYFLLVIILFWLIFSLIKSYQQKDLFSVFALILILVGAFSNLLDRWQYGAVIDYFDLPFVAIFNVADMMILAGVIILIWRIIVLDYFHKSDKKYEEH